MLVCGTMQIMDRRIDISYRTIFFITAFLVSLWIIYLIKDIILLLFVAFILMSALFPLVNRLKGFGIPKILSLLIVFLGFISAIIFLLTAGFTPLISEIASLSEKLTEAINNILKANVIDQSVVRGEFANLSHQVINFTFSLVENFIGFVSVIVITFYLLLDREKIEERFTGLFGPRQEQIRKLLDKIEDKLGAWLRGQIILSAIIGILVYTSLVILGLEFALPLAIIAAILEVVPVIGPIIAALPAILVALVNSPLLAILVAAVYLAIQQLEGHIIVPQVMKRAVGLNPLAVIIAISVGGRLLGLAGALLAVPITVVIQIIIIELLRLEKIS